MMLRAAGGKHVEIALGKTVRSFLIDPIKRIHQAIAERIGVDVKRRMDEVRNISPERLVSRTQPNRRAETVGLHAHPDVADVFGRKLAFGTAGVQLAFERIERDLSDDRV